MPWRSGVHPPPHETSRPFLPLGDIGVRGVPCRIVRPADKVVERYVEIVGEGDQDGQRGLDRARFVSSKRPVRKSHSQSQRRLGIFFLGPQLFEPFRKIHQDRSKNIDRTYMPSMESLLQNTTVYPAAQKRAEGVRYAEMPRYDRIKPVVAILRSDFVHMLPLCS